MSRRVLLSWSSGKDSAWTLHRLRQDPDVEVVGRPTTVDTIHGRVAMHSTRLAIVEAIITCVDPKKRSPSFAGRKFDRAFLDERRPEGVDP